MEESRILNRGQSILLPYKDDMQMKISSEGADDFDIFSLNNNRTDKYRNCINITKYLSKGHLKLRIIKASTSKVTISYQGNVGKGTLTIGDETFDIFLSDTKISISIDENLCSNIHFISNETIDEDKIEMEKTKNKLLNEQYFELKDQYERLQEENKNIEEENASYQQKIIEYENKNRALNQENENYQHDIDDLEKIFSNSKNINEELKVQFTSALNRYGLTKNVYEEYKKECQSDEIINNLELIKQQLEQTEQLLKKFVENRQRMVEQIRAQIKPK